MASSKYIHYIHTAGALAVFLYGLRDVHTLGLKTVMYDSVPNITGLRQRIHDTCLRWGVHYIVDILAGLHFADLSIVYRHHLPSIIPLLTGWYYLYPQVIIATLLEGMALTNLLRIFKWRRTAYWIRMLVGYPLLRWPILYSVSTRTTSRVIRFCAIFVFAHDLYIIYLLHKKKS